MVSALKRTEDSLLLEGQRCGAIYVKVMTAIADRNVENEPDCYKFGGKARMLRHSLYRDPRFGMAMAIQFRLAGAVTKVSLLSPGDFLKDSAVQLRLSLDMCLASVGHLIPAHDTSSISTTPGRI
jgi:hypothetical protein